MEFIRFKELLSKAPHHSQTATDYQLIDERQALSDAIDLMDKHHVDIRVLRNCQQLTKYGIQGNWGDKSDILDKVFPPDPLVKERSDLQAIISGLQTSINEANKQLKELGE